MGITAAPSLPSTSTDNGLLQVASRLLRSLQLKWLVLFKIITWQMMRKTLESRDILFFADFHGHSRLKNVFMFGCSNVKQDRLKERIFPMLFAKNTDNFSFNNCDFNVQKQKETTARVVMWREFSLINSFTLESSFFGPTNGLY